ncbi:MAG: TIGR00730 family Rossman fold protein [Isosphaeraceae bacterium]
MPERRRVCVFCGSSSGSRPSYAEAARKVGAALAREEIGLVYGGGRVGLMGVVADAALSAGGEVVGIIPEPLATREVAHEGLTELIVVPGMHQRKALMAEKSSGFLALPGGVGTFEEFFEILTWAVLGIHQKPIGLLNVEGYFDPLLTLLGHAIAERFVRPEHLGMILVSDQPEALAARLLDFQPPPAGSKWIDLDQT